MAAPDRFGQACERNAAAGELLAAIGERRRAREFAGELEEVVSLRGAVLVDVAGGGDQLGNRNLLVNSSSPRPDFVISSAVLIDSQNWLLSGAFMKAEYDSRGPGDGNHRGDFRKLLVRLGIDGFDRARLWPIRTIE